MKISEIITDKYKLRIPPTVYYDLLADVREVEDQEPLMVEIDLYSVIKQKYIERDVLDKIRAEIEGLAIGYDKSPDYIDTRTDAEKAADWWEMYKKLVLVIIEKYREG